MRPVERVGGGDINEAFKAQFEDESFAFVKTRADVAPGEYAAEAAGLRWLAEPGALRVPEVLGVGDEVLVLDWVDEGGRGDGGRVRRGPGGDARGGRGRVRGAAARGAVACGSGRLALPERPRARLADVLRRAAAAARCSPHAGLDALRQPGGRARVRAASPTSPARPSRPRGCTATSGAATCCGAATAARG